MREEGIRRRSRARSRSREYSGDDVTKDGSGGTVSTVLYSAVRCSTRVLRAPSQPLAVGTGTNRKKETELLRERLL
eukprot:3104621-Pyramimonas_sp.AAC.1